jgi:hypothetical protein
MKKPFCGAICIESFGWVLLKQFFEAAFGIGFWRVFSKSPFEAYSKAGTLQTPVEKPFHI